MKDIAVRIEVEGGDETAEDRVHFLVEIAFAIIQFRREHLLQLFFRHSFGIDAKRFHREFRETIIAQKILERLDLLHLAREIFRLLLGGFLVFLSAESRLLLDVVSRHGLHLDFRLCQHRGAQTSVRCEVEKLRQFDIALVFQRIDVALFVLKVAGEDLTDIRRIHLGRIEADGLQRIIIDCAAVEEILDGRDASNVTLE